MSMYLAFVFGGFFVTCIHAYAPIQCLKFPNRAFVFTPQGFTGRFKGLVPPLKLTIHDPPEGVSPNAIPHFTVKPDQTIMWEDLGWCIEAVGVNNGDLVHVNRCTGAPAQKWNWIVNDHNRNVIQLKDSTKCISVNDRAKELNGAPIELQECADSTISVSGFEDLIPVQNFGDSQSPVFAIRMRHAMMALIVMVGVGALHLGTMSWRWTEVVPSQGAVPSHVDQEAGLCLSTSSTAGDNRIISEHILASPAARAGRTESPVMIAGAATAKPCGFSGVLVGSHYKNSKVLPPRACAALMQQSAAVPIESGSQFKRRISSMAAPRCQRVSGKIVAQINPGGPELAIDSTADSLCILSDLEASKLSTLRKQAPASPALLNGSWLVNLGCTTIEELLLLPDGVAITTKATSPHVTWKELAQMVKRGGAWHVYADAAPEKVTAFSELTGRSASMLPVKDGPPTVVLGGFTMHRIKNTNPALDTQQKLEAFGATQLRGRVLDICTGLGYTAIALSQSPAVTAVTTIELDPMMVQMQRHNPWSKELFASPKISRLIGDAVELLPGMEEDSFDCICHDPPTQAMSGELFSGSFYGEMHRLLRPGGTLYHYIGDPKSKASGRLFAGVQQRLRDCHFAKVSVAESAFGVVAIK